MLTAGNLPMLTVLDVGVYHWLIAFRMSLFQLLPTEATRRSRYKELSCIRAHDSCAGCSMGNRIDIRIEKPHHAIDRNTMSSIHN